MAPSEKEISPDPLVGAFLYSGDKNQIESTRRQAAVPAERAVKLILALASQTSPNQVEFEC
jgi:hypothetical protein